MSVLSATGLARTSLVFGLVLVLSACYDENRPIPSLPPAPATPAANPFVGEWLDAAGRPVPDASVEGEGLVVKTWVVNFQCEWGSATFMLIAWPPGRVDADWSYSDIEDGTLRQ